MQIYAISVLLFVTTALGYHHHVDRAEMSQFQQQIETTTPVNELDNSVYPENETPSPGLVGAPVPQFPEHMPTTGCFGHAPPPENLDGIKSNNMDAVDPLPPQYNNQNQYSTPQPFGRRYYPFSQQVDHMGGVQNNNVDAYPAPPASDPIPPQFNTFAPPNQFNRFGRQFSRPVMPFGPSASQVMPFGPSASQVMPFAPPPPPFQRFSFPNQQTPQQHPIIIVKLLQPIILPVAQPMFPEGGDSNPDEIDNEKFTAPGFQRGHGFHRFGGGGRRFSAEKFRSVERPMPYRQRTFGPYKVGADENIHVTVKLH